MSPWRSSLGRIRVNVGPILVPFGRSESASALTKTVNAEQVVDGEDDGIYVVQQSSTYSGLRL